MYPSIVVCKGRKQYAAYPCSAAAAPSDDSILPMMGFGETADKALDDLHSTIKRFVELYGSSRANFILESIYGKDNHVDLTIDYHPMMKYFTEIN